MRESESTEALAAVMQRPSFGALSYALGFARRVFVENVTDPKADDSLTWIETNLRAMLDAYDARQSAAIANKPSDLDAWNSERLDAARITGTTAERQNDVISPEALERANDDRFTSNLSEASGEALNDS